MMNELKKRTANQKGLTLIELLAVIVILAIIAAIAIPAIGNIISNSRDKAILSESLNIISGAKIAYMDGKCGIGPDYSCSGEVLKDYVDGAELTGTNAVTVTYNNSSKDWSITYPKFSEIATGSTFKLGDTTGPYTETVIKSKLDPPATP